MSTVADTGYAKDKKRVVEDDRRELIVDFVGRYGFEDGLRLLSMRTGQPVAIYKRLARRLGPRFLRRVMAAYRQ